MADHRVDVTEQATVSVNNPHRYITEASTLGIRPGKMPHVIDTPNGNGQPFILTRLDTEAANYEQGNGCLELTVFND